MKKQILIFIGIVAGFLLLSYAFVPEVLSGKMVNQSDISGWIGMSHETTSWDAAHPGQHAKWTGSMFSGMPTAPIVSSTKGDWTQPLYDVLLTGKRPATYFFVSLLGAFLLLLSLGVSPLVAAGGAVAVTFCSYNMQIIQVGHNTKMQAIAFAPWVLAALIFTYRKAVEEEMPGRRRWTFVLLGSALFGLAVSFQVKANHPQISYYLALMILIYVVVLFVWMLVHRKPQKFFWIASVLLLVLGLAGIGTNAVKLLPTMEYTPYSMRGGDSAAPGGSRKGLDIDYATAWSYGWEELPNLAIPNYNGGASSGTLSMNSETVQLLRRAGQGNLAQVRKSMPTYWGPQPFTAGPMYMGAVTVFLFILGLMYWKGKEKWWIVASTLLAVLLALGNHFLWFTRLFYDFVPLYNKFRTVSMSLVVLQYTLPVLGFLMLDRVLRGSSEGGLRRDSSDGKLLRRQVLTAGGVTMGILLLAAVVMSAFGSFSSPSDAGMAEVLADALAADRMHLMWTDTLRSLLFVAGAALLLLWGVSGEGKRRIPAVALVCVLVLADLFTAGKRYLNSDDFTTPKSFKGQFDQRPVDEYILADTDPSYRVLDLTANVFNDSHPSYWHKNIGGYSPAKLQSYQAYIDSRLSRDLSTLASAISKASTVQEAEAALPYLESLASLNCRYIIVSGDALPLRYPFARGNAWFEDGTAGEGGDCGDASLDEDVAAVGSKGVGAGSEGAGGGSEWADGAAVGSNGAGAGSKGAGGVTAGSKGAGVGSEGAGGGVGSKGTAAGSKGAAGGVGSKDAAAGSGDAAGICAKAADGSISLTSYSPDVLEYAYVSPKGGRAVFSEVYYPAGWVARLEDGTQLPIELYGGGTDARGPVAAGLLRCIDLPAGQHTLTMSFEPASYSRGEALSRACSILLLLLVLGTAAAHASQSLRRT